MLQEPGPSVNPWLQILTLFGLFVAGGMAGLGLSAWAAPESGLAAGISVILLPAAFAGGLLTWSGLDLVFAVINLIRGRPQHTRANLSSTTKSWFVPLSVTISGAGGLVVALLPGGPGVSVTVVAYCAAGIGYGLVVATLAARGYVPAPHSS